MRPLYSIDLKLLRAFDTVVRCGGFSAAQAMLNISQSMISEYMGQLEIRLGAKLCERGRGGFRLTEVGEAYHAALQQLFVAIDEFSTTSDVLRKGTAGKLDLGIIDNTLTDPMSPVPSAVRSFTAQNPQARIAVRIGTPNELEVSVLDRRLDLAIGHFPIQVSGLVYTALYDEEYGLYCGRNSPLFNRSAERNSVLHDEIQHSRIVARRHLRDRDLEVLGMVESATTADNSEAQAILIMTGASIGFMPKHYAQRWVESGDLQQLLADEFTLKSPIHCITRKGAAQPPAVESFFQSLRASNPPVE